MKNFYKTFTIVIGSDQMGFPLKQAVINYLEGKGITIIDVGPFSDDKKYDYPDYAQLVSTKVLNGEGENGIAICGTGIGMSIAANKLPGIRAALCHDPYTAHQARAHNDANVLCMGAWIVSSQRVSGILDEWLLTEYEGGRHEPRLQKIASISVHNALVMPNTGSLKELKFGVALSPRKTVFGPILFAGELKKGFEEAKKLGFDAVELSLRKPGDLAPQELKNLLRKYDLELSAIATGQSCLHDFMCLASPDTDAVRTTVERIKGHIKFASEFGSAVIIGGIRGKLSGSETDQKNQRKKVIIALRECAQTAKEYSIQLLIEPINRYETNFINTVHEGIDLIEEIGFPEIKLLLDTFHMNIEEADIPKTIHTYKDSIGYLHFADSNRLAPGWGHIPYDEIMTSLLKIDYQGFISAEILPIPDDESAIKQAGEYFMAMRDSQLSWSSFERK